MDENWGRPTPNLYVYLICAVFLGLLIIIIIPYHYPDVTGNSEDRVSKSPGDLIRKIPQSKDCCFIEKNEPFQLDCDVRNPCSKGARELKQKIICHG